jgi:hypothetical protein
MSVSLHKLHIFGQKADDFICLFIIPGTNELLVKVLNINRITGCRTSGKEARSEYEPKNVFHIVEF